MKKIVLLLIGMAVATNTFCQSTYWTKQGLAYYSKHLQKVEFDCFKKGEAAGEAGSAVMLAYCYLVEHGTTKNVNTAAAILYKSYKKNTDCAQAALVFFGHSPITTATNGSTLYHPLEIRYLNICGTEVKFPTSDEVGYKGDINKACEIALYFLKTGGYDFSYAEYGSNEKAKTFFDRLEGAENRLKNIIYNVANYCGYAYENGITVPKDEKKALRYYAYIPCSPEFFALAKKMIGRCQTEAEKSKIYEYAMSVMSPGEQSSYIDFAKARISEIEYSGGYAAPFKRFDNDDRNYFVENYAPVLKNDLDRLMGPEEERHDPTIQAKKYAALSASDKKKMDAIWLKESEALKYDVDKIEEFAKWCPSPVVIKAIGTRWSKKKAYYAAEEYVKKNLGLEDYLKIKENKLWVGDDGNDHDFNSHKRNFEVLREGQIFSFHRDVNDHLSIFAYDNQGDIVIAPNTIDDFNAYVKKITANPYRFDYWYHDEGTEKLDDAVKEFQAFLADFSATLQDPEKEFIPETYTPFLEKYFKADKNINGHQSTFKNCINQIEHSIGDGNRIIPALQVGYPTDVYIFYNDGYSMNNFRHINTKERYIYMNAFRQGAFVVAYNKQQDAEAFKKACALTLESTDNEIQQILSLPMTTKMKNVITVMSQASNRQRMDKAKQSGEEKEVIKEWIAILRQ